MRQHNISRFLSVDRAMAAVAAGTGDEQLGDIIDGSGCESIAFLVSFGGIVANGAATITIQYGTQPDGSDMADIPGATVGVPDSGQGLVFWGSEIVRPTKRYLRLAIVRIAHNVAINGAVVLRGRLGIEPAVQGTNMGNNLPNILISP
jgi:hypothetical protein